MEKVYREIIRENESLPDRPDRRNYVGYGWMIKVYDIFSVAVSAGKEDFSYNILFTEVPKGYRLKKGSQLETIGVATLCESWEEYEKLMFHPTDENINKMLINLEDFLKYMIKEKKENHN